MGYEDIIFTKEHMVATIRFNRSKAMNSFSPRMMDEIFHALEEVKNDPEARVLVFASTGRSFSTGADVKAMAERNAEENAIQRRRALTSNSGPNLALTIRNLDKPVIASINGFAVGGGLDLALACDIRIASDQAKFAEVFIRRGLIPALGGTFFLPRLVGLDKACELIWTGDMVDAAEALKLGLVTKVVPHDELEDATYDLATKLSRGAPLAIQAAKRAIYDGLQMNLEETLHYVAEIDAKLSKTEDHKEGAKAFVEKREPHFMGK
ncbi:MAG: enoyl-CoA hydratase/isomerase family protein [Candidatus Tectomicrobia bacterium]|uniref:Enoyl-CoA hydratase/isomerase family protein n=1 Tax=Tectimicrobiota bacterium TaxID=2528274 RepID=A0A933GM98_UNCTE|nr:enoyl-CoA hydratase/isomerase family protein [Candidatus Tectomicrobia bacterium]